MRINNKRDFKRIPNLLYKDNADEVVSTGFTYKPSQDYNDVATDWSGYANIADKRTDSRSIMTLPNTGCAHDCPWCGGSRYAYRKIMGVKRTLINKDSKRIFEELKSLGDAAKTTSIYALQCYSETRERLHKFLDYVLELEYKSVHFEQYHLTDEVTLKKMGKSTQAYINLSPESHDPIISRMSGRGNFTMSEMETWIPKALDAGIRGVMVWFFIGMPRQDKESVRETIVYCEHLLNKFHGKAVLPLLCPMVPFLDPGSRFFEEPREHGYKIFFRGLEEHRQAMVAPLWHRRLNYETNWMTRKDIQEITYESIDKLVEIKGELKILSKSLCRTIRSLIEETTDLLCEIEKAIDKDGHLPLSLRRTIQSYNHKILAYSSDQLVPMERPFGGRWFDDFTIPPEMIEEVSIKASM